MTAELARGSRPRVVVTGLGSVSALGAGDGAAVGAALARGLSGIGPVRGFPTEGCLSRLGGEVGDLTAYLRDGEERRLARASQLAVVAARLAVADADFQPGQLAAAGLVLGSHWGDFRSSETFALGFLERGLLALSPLVFPNTVMNAMAAQVAIAVGLRGPMLTLNEVDVAGELAVARGAALIVAGRATTVLAGGSDELSPTLYRELSRLGIMSRAEPGPEGCWPFDRRASGTVLGEGATFSCWRPRRRPWRVACGCMASWRERRGVTSRRRPTDSRLPGGATPGPSTCPRSGRGRSRVGEDGVPHRVRSPGARCVRARPRGPGPRTGRTRLTALTPLTGEHAGLGGLRAAAAALEVSGWQPFPLPGCRRADPTGSPVLTPRGPDSG